MRLRKYLIEAVIEANKKELKIIDNILQKQWFNYSAYSEREKTDIYEYMKKASAEITKKLSDVTFIFMEESSNPNLRGSAGMGIPKHVLFIHYQLDDTYDAWNDDSMKEFKVWLHDIMDAVEHEMTHIEQYRRIGKEKDPQKAMKILDLQRTSNDKSYVKKMDAYLNYSLEIMAHAKSAELELRWYNNPDEIMERLRSTWGHNELSYKSKSFNSYFTHIENKYPKTWKKFIKYLTMYVQKRKK